MDKESMGPTSVLFAKARRIYDGKWVEGSLIYIVNKTYGRVISFIIPEGSTGEHVGNELKSISPCFSVIPATICRCSEIRDYYERNIYQGDVIESLNTGEIYIVKYENGKFTAVNDNVKELNLIDIASSMNIKGNILDKSMQDLFHTSKDVNMLVTDKE